MTLFYAAYAALNVHLVQHWVRVLKTGIDVDKEEFLSYHYLYSLLLEEKVEYSDFYCFSEVKKKKTKIDI